MSSLTIIFIVIFLLIIFLMLKGQPSKVKYDERQTIIRNQGFKYAFGTIAIIDLLLFFLTDYLNLKIKPVFLLMVPLLTGLIIFSIYTVAKGVSHGFNEKKNKSAAIITLTLGIIELIFAIIGIVGNPNNWQNSVVNILVGLALAIPGFTDLLQLRNDKKANKAEK